MNAAALPPLADIQAALSKTTELLAHELHVPTPAAPSWNEFEWSIARAVMTLHGISVLLANRLRWIGPPAWRTFLDQQRDLSQQRDARIARLIHDLDVALRAAQLGAVGLKGTALRSLGIYLPGERPMGDVDLLVAPGARAPAAKALATIGYEPRLTTWRDTIFEPLRSTRGHGVGEHPDHPIKIEVHEHIAESLPHSVVEVTAAVMRERMPPGIGAYPTTGSLMLHLLLHCAGNMRANALRLLQLHDVAKLSALMNEGDWLEIRKWWAYPPLALVARYYPGCIPADRLAHVAMFCPARLRAAADRWSLSEVSWSNLKLHALPGVVWARSPLEVARFAVSRVWPSREMRSKLGYNAKSQPQMSQIPWYGLSHRKRLVRWLVARPPRVQTMVSVRAALESAP
jgi:hypothetical protein